MENTLLTRTEFREQVFSRDGYKCIFCDLPAKDAHHIMERKLWNDGGYYIDNGASVCEKHHIDCEKTIITLEEIREKCGILKPLIPNHLYDDYKYDKWGNYILPNGTRLRGELFYNDSVQKILKEGNVLDLFLPYVKYPRTNHVPWSESLADDDRMHESMSQFEGKRVIITEKMDGENTSCYCDYIHARSLDSINHESRNWVKNFWSSFAHDIPKDWRICGENLYAKHSIGYIDLPTYFMGFSIWNERNICLSWDETLEWFELLNILNVPVLYDDIYDENKIKSLYDKNKWDTMEGYVIRIADSFSYGTFRYNIGKFVRKNHIQTVKHWMHGQAIEKNKLRIMGV